MKKSAVKIFIPIIGAGLLLSSLILFKSGVDRWTKKFKANNSAVPTDFKVSGASETWFSQVIQNIQSCEFYASKDKDGQWSMPNRKHNFRARFSTNKVELEPRVRSAIGTENAWNWQWQTAFIGRAGGMLPTSESRLQVNNNRVEYSRNELIEWYENKSEGLEQGFILKSSPKSVLEDVSSNPVRIVSQPIKGLQGRLDTKGRFIEFINNQGGVILRYAKLKVWDAFGKELQANMGFENQAIVISIDDHDAHYPIYIDPILTTPAWTAEGNQSGASFGYSVSTAGDVNGDGFSDVIIGVCGYDNGENAEGRVYGYLGSASGLSTSPNWIVESNVESATFGNSVATAGDVNGDGYDDVIIGAWQYSGGQSLEGRAYVYLGSPTGLSTSSAWTIESNLATARYGCSVSGAGDVNGDGYGDVIVGAYNYSNGETGEGKAFLYYGSSLGLSTTASWSAEGNQANAKFGVSVSSAGDVNGDGYCDVIVGASGYDNGQSNEGRAYLYLGSSLGLGATPAWTAESNQNDAEYACSVSSAGDVNGDGYSDVLVGSKYFDNGQNDEGRVFVYLGSSTGLAVTAAWTAENNNATSSFGFAVNNAGDVNGDGFGDIIVGAITYDNDENDEGAAYLYLGSSTGLGTSPIWMVEGNQAGAKYGCSVSSAGDVNGDGYNDLLVGSRDYTNGETNEGRAYVYHGSSSGLTSDSVWSAESNQASAKLGYTVGYAGDVNGDGYGDVLVGVPYYDTGLSNIGQVFVFHGSSEGLNISADQTLEGTQANELFGFSVSTAGDINGDGYSDIIVGAPEYSDGESKEGKIYVYLGNVSGIGASAVWTRCGDQADAQLGFTVACAGDVNGDGYSDILASSPFFNNQGQVCLYSGSESGLSNQPLWTANGSQIDSEFGYSISSAGDVNGDGFSDVIIGSPLYDNDQVNEGRVYVYLGHSGGLSTEPVWTQESNQDNAKYGYSVSSAGDVNGDGFSDIVVGASLYDGTQSNEGRAYVYHGSSTGFSSNYSWDVLGGQNSIQLGCSVATAGDVNNDGYSDVVVGAYQVPNGRAYLFYGSSSGLVSSAEWIEESDQSSSEFGYSVASAGDINGDGYGDVIVGAPNYNNGQNTEGRAFLYYGNVGAGAKRLPLQLYADGSQKIGPAGTASNSANNTDFLIRLFSKGSQGRESAKLQVQVAQVGQPLNNGALYTQSTYTDLGIAGSDLNFTITGLEKLQAYRWRARLIYDNSLSSAGELFSPWIKPSWGSLNGNADFRTGPVAPATATSTPIATLTPIPTSTPIPRIDDFHGQIIDGKYFFVYPNPVRGTTVRFKFFLNSSAKVKIRVFTPSNQFVWENEGCYAQGWNELAWNTTGMANGIYLYLVEAESDHIKERIVKKIGLVK